jgi:hypothetical protein
MGVNPNNWNRQSSDQFVTQGESSKSHQEMDYKKQDRQERERLASELSKNYSELSNAKLSLAEARKKISHETKKLERLKKTLDEARRKKEESTKKYLASRITYEDLKKANQEFTNLSKSNDSIMKGIEQAKRDINQYTEDIKNLELEQKKLYKKLENVRYDRHMKEFLVEVGDHLLEENRLDTNSYLLFCDAVARLSGEQNTRYGNLIDTKEYKAVENIIKDEFEPWQKQKKKEEALTTQLLNRLRKAVSRRKHSEQRENLSQPE